MKVLITGATGLVGQAIVDQCHKNDIDVHYLTTSRSKIVNQNNYKGFYWNPTEKVIDLDCLEGVDSIINLAGSSIAKRWTKAYKDIIIKSRTSSLALLRRTLKHENHTVKHLICASAIGVYPDSLTNYYNEDYAKISPSFLGEVVEKWENAADTFADLGIIVSKVRIGLVLDKNEGALPQMVKPISLGIGSAFGKGDQWQSWIHVEDLARIFLFVRNAKLPGVFNGVAPNPISNLELTKSIADQLDKPLFMPNIPKFLMKLVLGETHILLFESQRVCSKKISDLGFEYNYVNLKPALQNILN